jgi:serine/threonine-protein kinase
MACLDESTVVDLLGQNLPEAARRSALAHVETCEACRELLVALSSDEAFFPTEPAAGLELDRPQSPAGEAFGSYRLLRPVGEGGVGIVYAAVDERTGVVWALKVLKDVEGSHTARFRREARVGATLSHPSIANVHEVVEHEGRIAIVSPLLHGESLDRRLYRQSPLPVAGACRVLAGLAGALAFAHQNGVVHRDVKPQNVFLVGDPLGEVGAQEVKLLDFGLAKAFGAMGTSTQLTETGVVLGTPHYMAPEQILGAESVSTAADVWALGVVAYECLSGIRPIEGKSFGQIFKRLTQERVVPLSTRALDLPPKVVALVDALLAMAPEDRPSAEEAHTVLVDAVP